jgi:hypothetical protein
MTQITRVYDTHQKAVEAVSGLHEYGFTDSQIILIDGSTAADPAATAAAIAAENIPPADVDIYAQAVAQGASLVTVDASFGTAAVVTEIMRKPGPMPITVTAVEIDAKVEPWDDAAPLSSALHMPVLITRTSRTTTEPKLLDDPTPLSTALGIRVLSQSSKLPSLLPTDWSLSGLLGLPMLSQDPAPLSRMLGRRVLSDNPTPLSTATNQPVLLDNPTPLSSKFGWRVLSEKQ